MNSDENNKAVDVVNDEVNNSEQQQHLVEPTDIVSKTGDEGAAPSAENEQAAADSAENKEEIAQAKKNFMDRNKIMLFSDEQKLSQKIGFAINRVKAGEVIIVEAFGNSISRGITVASIVRDRLSQDDNDKKDVYIQTSFISRTNDKTGKSYSGMQFKLSADKDKLDQDCVGFQKPGDELKNLRMSPRANSTRPRNRQRRNDANNNSSTRRRSASQNKKSSSKLEPDSKRDKSASNRRSKSSQKTNQQNQPKAKDEKSQQSRRRSNSRKKTDKDNNPAPAAANDNNQSLERRRQQRRQRRNNNKSQDKDASASNSHKQNQRNQQAEKRSENNRQQRRTRSRSNRKQNQVDERPAQSQNNQRPRRQRNNGNRPDQEPAPPSARSYRSNQRDDLPPRQQQQQNRRSARPENQRSDQQQRYPVNGRPYAGYGRRGGYGQLPEPPRFAQKQAMSQSIFSNGSYLPQQRQQGPRPGYFPANKDSRPGYFPANKDPRMPLNAPISDYRQQSAQHQYPSNGSGYGGRPMAHRYRDAEQRLPPQATIVHQ